MTGPEHLVLLVALAFAVGFVFGASLVFVLRRP